MRAPEKKGVNTIGKKENRIVICLLQGPNTRKFPRAHKEKEGSRLRRRRKGNHRRKRGRCLDLPAGFTRADVGGRSKGLWQHKFAIAHEKGNFGHSVLNLLREKTPWADKGIRKPVAPRRA